MWNNRCCRQVSNPQKAKYTSNAEAQLHYLATRFPKCYCAYYCQDFSDRLTSNSTFLLHKYQTQLASNCPTDYIHPVQDLYSKQFITKSSSTD